MKVKIGNNIYDSEETPIMLLLTDKERTTICSIRPESMKYVWTPKYMTKEDIQAFMGLEN